MSAQTDMRSYLLEIATHLECAVSSITAMPMIDDPDCIREHQRSLDKAVGAISVLFLTDENWLLEHGCFSALSVRQTIVMKELEMNASGYAKTLKDWVIEGLFGLQMCSLYPELSSNEAYSGPACQVAYEVFLVIVGYLEDLDDIEQPSRAVGGGRDE
jgi:hypothetical protein